MRYTDSTKFQLPRPNASHIDRPRLQELLTARTQHPLTLVVAPAGYGKSALVSRWASIVNRPVAWVGLNGSDTHAPELAAFIVEAVRSVTPDAMGFGRAVLDRLDSSDTPDIRALAKDITRSLAGLTQPVTLVVDNLTASSDDNLHMLAGRVIEQLPANARIVITSRSIPVFNFARLRAQGDVSEIRYDALAFTNEETRAFLNDSLGLGLTIDQIATLQSRTEGWIAGLRLASLTLHDSSDIPLSVEVFNGTNRYVQSYLIDEVLSAQPDEVREFLMETSIVSSFGAELAAVLTGRRDSAALIDRILRENLFIFATDDSYRHYRYHRLFADVLRFRLERDSPDRIGPLHRAACTWLMEHNRPQEAASHAIDLRDWDLAVKLLDPLGGSSVVRFHAIVDWIRTLPEYALRMQPVLSLWNAWSEMQSGHVRAAERAIDIAEQEWKARGETQYRGEVLYLRSLIARCRGEGRLTVSLAEQSLSILPADAWMLTILSTISLSCGHAISGLPVEAEAAARDACLLAQQVDNAGVCILGASLAYVGQSQTRQGRLNEAWNTLHEALSICSRSESGVPIPVLIALGELLIDRNELDESAKLLNDAFLRTRQENAAFHKPSVWMQLARIAWAQENNDLAMSTLDHTLSWCRRNGCKAAQMSAEAFRARIWLAEGNHAKTQAWLERCSLDEESDIPYDQEPAFYVQARFLLHQYRSSGNPVHCERALHSLKQLASEALADNRRLDAVQALVLAAIARDELGDIAMAFTHLERAFALALPERAMRIFLDEGDAMLRLAHMARDRGSMGAQLDMLIEAFERTRSETRQNASPPEARVIELSKREQEILHYIAAGLTNQEIADRMFISVNTVKTHLKHIFSKVGATSRAQAIARAYALGLL